MQGPSERHVDLVLENMAQRVSDIKNSLETMVHKLERESHLADWPSYLDSYSVISAQIYTLLKLLRNEKTPILRNYQTLPLQLSAEPDDQLLKATDGRVPSFSHDFVPNALRTKPDPENEAKQTALENRMGQMNSDTAMKQINNHNKVVKNVIDLLGQAKENWDSDAMSRTSQPQTSSINETNQLVVALGTGRGIKGAPGGRTAQPGPSPTLPTQQPQQMSPAGKAPSGIKTNIKSAGQMHPYGR